MAQPTPYNRAYSFTAFQQATPTTPLPGDKVDLELNGVKITLDQLLANLALIQRDDGALKNGIVTKESLASSLSIGFTFRGIWASGVNYIVGDGVSKGSKFYICQVANTSAPSNDPTIDLDTWSLAADFTAAATDAVTSLYLMTFSGTGSQTSFTMTSSPASPQNLLVSISGVFQPVSAYSVVGSTLTFNSAPPSGTNNIEVRAFQTVSVPASIPASTVYMTTPVAGGSNAQTAIQNVYSATLNAASAASSAQTTANTANTAAINAQSTANTALTNAATANTNALNSAVGTVRLDDEAVTFTKVSATAIASQAEAEAGLVSNKLMTPQRTAQAISALAGAVSGRLLGVTYFTSSGTWTKATLNPGFVIVEVIGGGGGGGGAASASASQVTCGGGGGSGGYSRKKIVAASLGATETVTVGAGGSAGANTGGNGGTGGTTSFGAHCSATGGSGGVGSGGASATGMSKAGGSGGTGSSGDVNLTGSSGTNGMGNGASSGGTGGASALGGSGKGASAETAANVGGDAPSNTGGGGGGAAVHNLASSGAGGAGGSGIVIVWEFA